jgi:hypothetical protein
MLERTNLSPDQFHQAPDELRCGIDAEIDAFFVNNLANLEPEGRTQFLRGQRQISSVLSQKRKQDAVVPSGLADGFRALGGLGVLSNIRTYLLQSLRLGVCWRSHSRWLLERKKGWIESAGRSVKQTASFKLFSLAALMTRDLWTRHTSKSHIALYFTTTPEPHQSLIIAQVMA